MVVAFLDNCSLFHRWTKLSTFLKLLIIIFAVKCTKNVTRKNITYPSRVKYTKLPLNDFKSASKP